MNPLAGIPLSTSAEVLSSAATLASVSRRADTLLVVRATEWADLHPTLPGEGGAFDDEHLPGVAWEAPAELALAVGLSHDAGTRLIHEALELRHRLPRVWSRLLAGELPAWRARRIAERTIGRPDDVAAHIDEAVGPIAHKVGPVTLGRLLDEAMLRLYPRERELAQLEALEARRVRVFEDVSHDGVGLVEIRADLKDIIDFDATVGLVAQALAERGCAEPLDVRRSMAVGVLADPQGALDLLTGTAPSGRPRKQIQLFVHLTAESLKGLAPVGRCEWNASAVLEQQVRSWCGREDTHLAVTGILDLSEHLQVDSYEVPERLAQQVEQLHHACAYPHCTRRARRCDKDHRVPFHANGPTCSCNLAPLCRRHHRMKTFKGWRYLRLGPATYLWRSPHGRWYVRDPQGTLAFDDRDWTECHPEVPLAC
ncbi:MAG TPA: HNH endonuclease signature motif containing protein [Nocardioides sp.]|uniref:HNH endonuclease signature motif containing protein n=1 Tax=Nocardioides sp. TaxID=35761 RepID=UPI002C772850|nr:HNH endonuclease signature motif containing protein [Nocardioides sp.]HQR26997.1 HNH endonuclease signature motif containing protein [Nocardioides sp.]